MASQIGVPFQDQNFSVQHKGGASSLLGKMNSGKSQKKAGGLGGRKPLGEISNSAKIAPSQAPKKSTVSKVSGKAQTRSRNALSDISNCGKAAHLHEAPKNKKALKLSTEKEEHNFPVCIEDEKFLHDHSKCIKAQSNSMDVEEFLALVGLSNASSKQVESPHPLELRKMKAESFDDMELFEIPEDEFLWEQTIDSPICRTPKSPSCESPFWGHCDSVNFKLMESP